MRITGVHPSDSTLVELQLDNGRHILLDFYGPDIFRFFSDSAGKSLRPPTAEPPASILVDQPKKPVGDIRVRDSDSELTISTAAIRILFEKNTSQFRVQDLRNGRQVLASAAPLEIGTKKTVLHLIERPDEYFYGGGVQNGRFSHKGHSIAIENLSSWTDGGVASPCPFYWSTGGYGILWYSFKKGHYDFGSTIKGEVRLQHETDYADFFVMIGSKMRDLLNGYYQLTGHPVLLPKFAFYEGHLNAYNRDFWKEDTTGILFEDGKKYKERQKNNGGIPETLNGEKNNYQFSARAVIDRYNRHDMPLGWILPNDGYGAGYGQTGTLDSNILNLKSFGDYARDKGVAIGLWTQSDLHPKAGVKPLLQRDIIREVRDAGVRVLKTDVAWVGPGYSFGLNGIADVAAITPRYGSNARPFIITLNGWAGTQRFAGIWTGDQTGGQWEYIRFHIPTYIGSGLSGQPNIGSDMDGIFGGKNIPVQVRDFQWKTFTPMELNMDGWGANPKYPEALGEPATSINRNYLKLKSALLPYTYSIARTAVNGLPIIRALFLEQANPYTLGTATRYEYMYGPYFLVAPVYQDTRSDDKGNDIRHNIYLPDGRWFDFFTGQSYEGGRIYNHFDAPLWKLPLFVKAGAILPMTLPNNNPGQIPSDSRIFEFYPGPATRFIAYDDDGRSEAYLHGQGATTAINAALKDGRYDITIEPTQGNFDGMENQQETRLRINISRPPGKLRVKVGPKKQKLKAVNSRQALENATNVYFYDAQPDFNRFATQGADFTKTKIIRNPQLLIKLAKTDISRNRISVSIRDLAFDIAPPALSHSGPLAIPSAKITDTHRNAFALTPSWTAVKGADFYEILFEDMYYTHITDTLFRFSDLEAATRYDFKIRAVNKDGHSDWVSLEGHTRENPLQYALTGVSGYCTAAGQGVHSIDKLFDGDAASDWHTEFSTVAVPFEILIDLKSVSQLDKFQYLPRSTGTNGIITHARVLYSMDKKHWTLADSVAWERDNTVKEFVFSTKPTARYLKIMVSAAAGKFGSGRELYIFKVPGSPSYIPGDINNDGKIDENDLTSYTNYTGLRKGDGDFDGYISNGDINKNGLIDAYDISQVAVQLNGGAGTGLQDSLQGSISLSTDKRSYQSGELVTITVKAADLKAVNAFSFALPYNNQDYEYLGMELLHTGSMENLSYDRLHSNGKKALYPSFVNIGDQPVLEGSHELFRIRFRARKSGAFELRPVDGLLVDRLLNEQSF
ncbi:glycoside hydrolase family 31 protein [Niabella terrae]